MNEHQMEPAAAIMKYHERTADVGCAQKQVGIILCMNVPLGIEQPGS